jgi:hypothetical protein
LAKFGYQSLIVCWMIGSIGFIVRLLAFHQLLTSSDGRVVHYCDFVLYKMGGTIFLSNLPENIYDSATQLQHFNALIAPLHVDHLDPLLYPPFFFAMMTPFALLPLTLGFIIWSLIGIAGGLGTITLLLRESQLLTAHQRKVFLVGAVVFVPFFQSLQVGYSSLLLLTIVAAFFWSMLKRKDIVAGLFLAFSAFKVQYFWFLFLPALMCKRIKTLMVGLPVAALLCALSAWRVGWSNIWNYPKIVLHGEPSGNVYQMVGFRGLISNFFPQSIAIPISGVVSILGSILLMYIWWRADHWQSQSTLRWAAALTAIGSLLFSPHSHLSDCTLLLISAALTLSTVEFDEAMKINPMSLRIWHLVFLISPIMSIVLFIYWAVLGQWMNMTIDPFLIFNIALFGSALAYFFQLPKNAEQPPASPELR